MIQVVPGGQELPRVLLCPPLNQTPAYYSSVHCGVQPHWLSITHVLCCASARQDLVSYPVFLCRVLPALPSSGYALLVPAGSTAVISPDGSPPARSTPPAESQFLRNRPGKLCDSP
jgi:hypothetical protein